VSFNDGDQVIAITDTLMNTGGSPLTNVATLDNTDRPTRIPQLPHLERRGERACTERPRRRDGTRERPQRRASDPRIRRGRRRVGFQQYESYTILSLRPTRTAHQRHRHQPRDRVRHPRSGAVEDGRVADRIRTEQERAIANYVGSLGVCGNASSSSAKPATTASPRDAGIVLHRDLHRLCDTDQCNDDVCDSSGVPSCAVTPTTRPVHARRPLHRRRHVLGRRACGRLLAEGLRRLERLHG
jgi:hypothetical protein